MGKLNIYDCFNVCEIVIASRIVILWGTNTVHISIERVVRQVGVYYKLQ